MDVGGSDQRPTRQSYSIEAAEDSSRIILRGTLRLQKRTDYETILLMMRKAALGSTEKFEIDLRDLQFLNSPGISTLIGFLVEMREAGKKIRIRGSRTVLWQDKNLEGFSRLFQNVVVDFAE